MGREGFKRKLTAILSADAVGYSSLMAEDETATVKTLTTYREVMSSLIKQHRGRVVDSPGDNVLAEFSSVVDAVQCAVAVQNEFQTRNAELAENRRMEFRIGINLGDVIDEGGRIYGDGVNVAARLEALADSGGICVSKTAFDQIETKLPLGYEYLGEQPVKNIPKPVGAYRVLMQPRVTLAKAPDNKKFASKRQKAIIAGVVVALLVAIGVGIWQFYLARPELKPASVEKMAFAIPDKPSIAVLPFDNLSGDQSQEYIADGLSENIISSLSKSPELFVIARNSTFVYKGKAVKVKQVAEELGVKYVLEGSVQKAGENLRVTAQLIDALKGNHLWSESYDRATKDFFSVQDDITRNILLALDVELGEGEQARLRYSTENLEAWGYATKGNALFELFTKEKNAKARELFKQAVNLDPNYTFAWIAIAWTHFIDFRYGFSDSRDESLNRCIEFTKKVTALNNSLPEVHSTWLLIYLAQRQYNKAIAAGKQAVNLGPSDAYIHDLLAMTLNFAGKFEEAIFHVKKAMRLDPYYPNYYLAHLAGSYSMAGQHEKAIAQLKKVIERAKKEGGQIIPDYVYLVYNFVSLGQMAEAKDYKAKILELDPNFSLENFQKSQFYKNPDDLDRLLNNLRKAGLPE